MLCGYLASSLAVEPMHYCCIALTETTSAMPGVIASLPSASASKHPSEILERSE